MFSEGQIYFAGFFIVAFIFLMIMSYKGDRSLHKKHYKGTRYILFGFLAFIIILFLIKFLIKE